MTRMACQAGTAALTAWTTRTESTTSSRRMPATQKRASKKVAGAALLASPFATFIAAEPASGERPLDELSRAAEAGEAEAQYALAIELAFRDEPSPDEAGAAAWARSSSRCGGVIARPPGWRATRPSR